MKFQLNKMTFSHRVTFFMLFLANERIVYGSSHSPKGTC